MAHKLSSKDGRIEMAYAGETPWHGLGTQVGGLQTAGDMLEKAGLLWTVSQQPIFLAGSPAPIPGFKALRRDDKDLTFAVTSERYHPIQNAQAGEVMDALIGAGANVEVAGALDEGQRCWMLARLPETFEVVKGDVISEFMLLAWGHDGYHGLAGKLTPVRVVCNNTLSVALGANWKAAADIYIRHTTNAKLRIDEALTALGLAKKQSQSTADAYRALAATPLTHTGALAYFAGVFPSPAVEGTLVEDEKLARWEAHQAAVLALYDGAGQGSEIAGVAGTVWGAFNAVTEWTDHVYPVLKSGEVSARRQQSVLFGGYADTKARALTAGLELAGAR